jgi:hypothetical protein
MKILKHKLLLGVPLAIISVQIYSGILLGYLAASFAAGKQTGEQGRFRSFVFGVGSYKFHFHHWLMGIGILPLALHADLSFLSNQFFSGLAGGLVFQGITCYSDWHKLVVKKDNIEI